MKSGHKTIIQGKIAAPSYLAILTQDEPVGANTDSNGTKIKILQTVISLNNCWLLCILTSEWVLRTPFAGWNHFLALKQVFPSFSITNGKKRTYRKDIEHLLFRPAFGVRALVEIYNNCCLKYTTVDCCIKLLKNQNDYPVSKSKTFFPNNFLSQLIRCVFFEPDRSNEIRDGQSVDYDVDGTNLRICKLHLLRLWILWLHKFFQFG